MIVVKIDKKDWSQLSEKAHRVVFKENKPSSMDRVDFALLCEDGNGKPLSYVTCRENDNETLYWQYGGVFPDTKNTVYSIKTAQMTLNWCKERYKRVHFYVENTNAPMLKLAQRLGFLITGVRNYHGHILVEHLMEWA